MRRTLLFLLSLGALSLWAADDFGIDYELDLQKKLNKKIDLGIEVTLATEDGGSDFDRIKFTPYVEYDFFSWLEGQLAFRWTVDEKERTKKSDYWRDLWQLRADLTPSASLGNFTFSWRVRSVWENRGWLGLPSDLKVGGEIQESFELRNRLKISWRSPIKSLSLYLSSEVYTAWDNDEVETSPRVSCWNSSAGFKQKWSKRTSTDLSLSSEREWEDGVKRQEITLTIGQRLNF